MLDNIADILNQLHHLNATSYYWYNYKKYRNKVTASIRKSKAKYSQHLFEENVKNPKQFWKILKTLHPQGNTSQTNSKIFEVAGKMEDNRRNIADGFCHAFTACAETLCSLLPSCFNWQNDGEVEQAQIRFIFEHVTKQRVLRHLLGLKSNKAPGHGDIPASLLKDASHVLAEPLTNITNKSLRQSLVPDGLRVVGMIPLPKPGSSNSIDSHRPISALPAAS